MADKKVQDWLIPNYPPIRGPPDIVGRAVIDGQMTAFPKVVRDMIDPAIPGQPFVNISYMLFPEEKTLRSGFKVFGFLKVRGAHASDTWAVKDAERICLEVDSKYIVRTAPMGHWVPITDDTRFCRDQLDAQEQKDASTGGATSIDSMRSFAAKEKEKQRQLKAKEIRERMEDVKEEDIYDDPEALKYYSMKRVTEMRLSEARENQEKRYRELLRNLNKTRRELKKIEGDHANYNEEWVDCYNVEREKVGIPPYIPGEDEFEEYDRLKLEDIPVIPDDDELCSADRIRMNARMAQRSTQEQVNASAKGKGPE